MLDKYDGLARKLSAMDQEQKIKETKQSKGEDIIRKYNEILQNKLSSHFFNDWNK